jgi:hypothetical protein
MKTNIVTIFILLFSIFNLQFAQFAPAYTPMSLENGGVELSTNSIILNANDFEIDFRENAQLTIYPNQFIWRLELTLPEFKSGHLAISNWLIPEGGRLFIFNNLESYTGPYLSKSEKEFTSGRFISDKLTLEYFEPVNAEFSGNFIIDGILPDFVIPSSQDAGIQTVKVKPERERPKIMVTGYWPPTNEMVRHFSQDSELNPAGWQGENWEGLGYDVVSFFPEFDPANCNNCGQGFGNLEVDYQDFSEDFWPIIEEVQPVGIITFSRGFNDMSWELENRVVNRTNWYDDYTPPLLPTPNPPDDSVDNYHVRYTSLPTADIINAINEAHIGLDPYLDNTNAGMFLSEFAGYHGVWYKETFEEDIEIPCLAGGHIHVGAQVDWDTAKEAAEVSIRTLINYVDQFMVMPGDCNSDGEVNILDVVALAGAVLSNIELTPSQSEAADMDGNGLLNILDIIAIVNLILTN